MPVTVDVPTTITASRIQEMLHSLGLGDLSDVKALHIDTEGIRAVVYARHPEHGRRYFHYDGQPDSIALHVVSIAVDWDA